MYNDIELSPWLSTYAARMTTHIPNCLYTNDVKSFMACDPCFFIILVRRNQLLNNKSNLIEAHTAAEPPEEAVSPTIPLTSPGTFGALHRSTPRQPACRLSCSSRGSVSIPVCLLKAQVPVCVYLSVSWR